MIEIERSLELPYGVEPLFDLVADIERYPEFVPGYLAARVTARDGDRLTVEQTVRGGPLRRRFRSEALLQRPDRLAVQSLPGALPGFAIVWRFEPLATGCRVRFRATLMAGPLERLATPWLESFSRRTLEAFRKRAGALLHAG